MLPAAPSMFLFHVRKKTRPEEGSNVVAGEDAHSPGDEGHAPQPAVVVLPEDADSFSLLQLQLVRSVSRIGVESHAPGESQGEGRQRLPHAGRLQSILRLLALTMLRNWCCWLWGSGGCLPGAPSTSAHVKYVDAAVTLERTCREGTACNFRPKGIRIKEEPAGVENKAAPAMVPAPEAPAKGNKCKGGESC